MTGAPLVGSAEGGNPCPCCDRPLPERAAMGGLMVTSDPWRVFWQGRAIGPFAPQQMRFLFLLVRFGRVASEVFEQHLRANTAGKAIHVHMSHLRALLRAAQIPCELRAIHGWGYELEMFE
jgi:hypothetical protein